MLFMWYLLTVLRAPGISTPEERADFTRSLCPRFNRRLVKRRRFCVSGRHQRSLVVFGGRETLWESIRG